MEKELSKLYDKKIAILGFGREGHSTYRFLRKHIPQKKLAILEKKSLTFRDFKAQNHDTNDNYVEIVSGEKYLTALENYDLVIKTPGIPNKLPELKKAKYRGVEFTSQTKLFFDLCRGTIIGVTGTKGKSTTTALIYHILKTANIPAVLLGNIGKPPLDFLDAGEKNSRYVFELSSHQLSDVDKSPHIAVFLNIFREHLDYYNNYNEYLSAKENITRFQSDDDIFIYNADVHELTDIARRTKAKKLTFSQEKEEAGNCFIRNGNLVIRENSAEKIIELANLPLEGKHNIYNLMASVLASYSAGAKVEDMAKAIATFKPLPTRLEKIGVFNGITFVSDTLATIPEATIAALDTYKGKVGTLICGGYDRGQDFSKLAKSIVENKVNNLILFPTTGERIASEVKKIKSEHEPQYYFTDSMEKAVAFAYKNTGKGMICLLSAASPSFTVFKDYEQEAGEFRENVVKMKKAEKPK